LIVDDDEFICKLVAVILSIEGYTVLTTSSGSAALGIMLRLPVSLLITEAHMPLLGGCELAWRARMIRPAMPIILMSSDRARDDFERTKLEGPSAFMRKPFSFQTLMTRVEDLVTRSRAVMRPAKTVD
jgi:DNA-binding response OmpR family regulator